ncbi:MAG: sugar transferase [Microthrixaceae bacterium]|nr:sugar transferase [Microthrixaceae bacterium]
MRRLARLLSYLGGVMAVGALSLYHASEISSPPYSFTGTFRFSWAIGYSLLLGVATYAVGLPDQPTSIRQATWLSFVAVVLASLGISIPQLATGDALLPRFVVFGAALVLIPWQVALNLLSRSGQQRDEERDRVLLVAEPAERERLIDDLRLEPEHAASLVATMSAADAAGTEPGLTPLLDEQARVLATVVVIDRYAQAEDRIIAQAAKLHESGVRVRTLQGFYEEWLGKLPISELERASLFFDIGEVHRARYGRTKRVMDLGLALLGLIPLLLVGIVTLAGNIVANRGPLLYRQVRVGKGGKHFTILKFRTMRATPPGASGDQADGNWTEKDDPRITPFGRILRRTHLDELPQVWNILRGDLSIVGPRPEQPRYVDELAAKLAFYDLRHLVRPGLTGWAQVKYGYAGDERDALEKLQYEFFYLRHQDLTFDSRIVLRTLRATIGGRGSGR